MARLFILACSLGFLAGCAASGPRSRALQELSRSLVKQGMLPEGPNIVYVLPMVDAMAGAEILPKAEDRQKAKRWFEDRSCLSFNFRGYSKESTHPREFAAEVEDAGGGQPVSFELSGDVFKTSFIPKRQASFQERQAHFRGRIGEGSLDEDRSPGADLQIITGTIGCVDRRIDFAKPFRVRISRPGKGAGLVLAWE